MAEKKKPGRFTIQFNMDDPQQRSVSDLLEQQGRRKAQFITSAILWYMQNPEPLEHSGGLPGVDEKALEQMMLAIMEKHSQFAQSIPMAKSAPAEQPAPEPWVGEDGESAFAAISNTLAAFRQG